MKAQLVKPVKYDLSSFSSVFTPVSTISKTEILSDKCSVKFYRIPDTTGYPKFYRIPNTGIRIQYITTIQQSLGLTFYNKALTLG